MKTKVKRIVFSLVASWALITLGSACGKTGNFQSKLATIPGQSTSPNISNFMYDTVPVTASWDTSSALSANFVLNACGSSAGCSVYVNINCAGLSKCVVLNSSGSQIAVEGASGAVTLSRTTSNGVTHYSYEDDNSDLEAYDIDAYLTIGISQQSIP